MTTEWVYLLLHRKYPVYIEPVHYGPSSRWLHEDQIKPCTIDSMLCKAMADLPFQVTSTSNSIPLLLLLDAW